jgi:predicted protein tyrosine phosphatase
MKQIYKNLFIGDDNDCGFCSSSSQYSVVHACKTCHQKALKYKGSLSPTHPNYLIFESGKHLYLNMVDMPNELLPKFTNPIFNKAMIFINQRIQIENVLIHCNQGFSRSPSLGLLFLVKTGVITENSFDMTVNKFLRLYPEYAPGKGIMLYMRHNWEYIINELEI